MSFFGLAAVNDLQPTKKSKSTVSKCKDLLFSVFAFPVGMVRNACLMNPTLCFNQRSKLCNALTLMFFAFLLVCCATFLDNLCLRQRISLPSYH